MRKTDITDVIITKGSNISNLNNNSEYIKPNEMDDVVNPKGFSLEQIRQMAEGLLMFCGEIYATSGNIGGCSIRDGVLQVGTAHIDGILTAKMIDVESVIAAGKSFIEELESHNVYVTSQEKIPNTDEPMFMTQILGNSIITKHAIWENREGNSYFIVLNRFYANNIEFVMGFIVDKITHHGSVAQKYYTIDYNNLVVWSKDYFESAYTSANSPSDPNLIPTEQA